MKFDGRKVVGALLIVVGLGFFAAAAAGPIVHGAPLSKWSYLALVSGALVSLAGLPFLSPDLFWRIVSLIMFVKGTLLSKEVQGPDKLRESFDGFFETKVQTEVKVQEHQDVAGFGAEPPRADEWNSQVRPVLHQASQYMAPTYYLNGSLQVIDWNLCFELIFERIVGELRGQHVNSLIVRLDNRDEVFAHARQFPDQVDRQPAVDTERLVYLSRKFGRIVFDKVATQLHDLDGQPQGWAVTLLIREMKSWDALIAKLSEKIAVDKFWSLYSVSYNRVLNRYAGYRDLLNSVALALPDKARRVVDLGAGTGNLSRALLDSGREVWAVEQNMAMLDIFNAQDFAIKAGDRLRIVKSSVEHLEILAHEGPFDAATALNVFYAVDHVPAALRSLNRILAMGGSLVFTTTDSDTQLEPLLKDIYKNLSREHDFAQLAPHVRRVQDLNRDLERTGKTTRYRKDEYIKWAEEAGFKVEQPCPRLYVDAVILVKARKVREIADDPTDSTNSSVNRPPQPQPQPQPQPPPQPPPPADGDGAGPIPSPIVQDAPAGRAE